jgi:hypothetical protein
VYTVLGEVYTDSVIRLIHGGTVFMNPGTADPVAHPGGVIWGPGNIDQEGPNSGFEINNVATGATFANTFMMNAALLNAAATGTKYVAGTFTDGVAINNANLTSFGGLQNPITGCRYVQTATAA